MLANLSRLGLLLCECWRCCPWLQRRVQQAR
jgi:hypothetical protein